MNTKQNPTGLTALAVTVLVWVALQLGVDLPAEVAVAIVGLAAGGVSYFTPRNVDS